MQKTQGGGGNTLTYLLSMIAMFCMISNVSAEVIDLEGQTIDVNGSAFKSNYNGHTIENGSVNLTGVADNENIKQGVFTIGNGATVKSTGEFRPNHDCTFYLKNGGAFSTDVVLCIPFRYGNSSFIMDGGTFTSSATQTYTGGYSVNIGYVWNNKTVWADNSAQLIMNNGSVFNVTQGTLCFGKSKSHEKKVNLKVDVAVTNSSIVVSKGQIVLSNNDNAWITDNAKSYVKVVFGPDSHITTGQIYADGIYPTPSVIFDGATIHWTGNNSSFIGHRNTAGDIYTIDSHGLTVDIPKGKALTCDSNASSLKGEGGITKIGEGSITWNKVSSGGSSGMTFTGPLTVTEGTWSSSLGYASKSFNVSGEGSVLELSGVLSADEINFNVSEGGLLKLTGATTPNDTAPDMSISAGGVLEDVSTEPRTFSALALGEGCAVKVAGSADGVVGILADELALSATEENQVALKFSSATEIPVGTYAVITINGEGAFTDGDDKKFSLEETVPENSQLTLSEDKKSLLLIVPATNPATWIGNAGDGKFSTAGNWLGGKVPGADDEIDIKAATDIELECDTSIAVKAISIHPESAKVTINGAGSITLSEKIVNASEKMMTLNVPVEFKTAEGGDAAIDVTGEVDFQGGVTGTIPVNHTTFYGTYTLTAQSWTLSSDIMIAAGATMTAPNMTIEPNGKLLNAESGSMLKIKQLQFNKDIRGNVFGTYAGELNVNKFYTYYPGGTLTFNNGFSGLFRCEHFHAYTAGKTSSINFDPAPSATIVMGGTGFESQTGWLKLSPRVVRSSGDWTIKLTKNNYTYSSVSQSVEINSGGFDIDTSDYDKSSVDGHTVTIVNKETKYAASADYLLKGGGAMSAFGNGTLQFDSSANFTGGFTASNGVTVVVKKGVYPGKGDVTIKDTATFKLVDSDSGTVPVAGKLTMEGGSTLHVPQFSASVVPISVNSLEFVNVENNKKVALKIDSGSLINGYNVILESDNAIPENAWSMIDVDISSDSVSIPEGMEASYVTQGNALCILVKGANDCIWTGSGETPAFSEQANWRDGKTPSNGANLYIPASSDITIINDIENFSPASITFSAGSGAVTIDGEEAIKVTAITNLSSSSHTINVPVYFNEAIAVVQNARGYKTRSESHIVFSGGAYANEGETIASWDDGYSWAVFGNYVYSNNSDSPYTVKDYKRVESDDIRFVVGDNSTLSIPYAGDMRELEICSGSVVNVGEMKLTAKNDRVTHKNLGEIAVTNLYITGSGDRFLTYDQSGNVSSVFKFMSVTNELSSNWFYLSDGNKATRHTVYVGELGLNFSQSATGAYCIGRNVDGNVETIRPWYSDFVIADHGNTNARIVFNRDVIFCTDDENGVGRKITVDTVTRGYSAPTITVSGSGILQINKMAQQDKTPQPPVSVIDTATLAYKPGASLGSGLTTVNAGATFQVAESGEVALDGDLNLADGAKLKFTFSKRNIAPVLDVAEKTVTLGENKALTVAIDGVKRPCAGRHVLTSGGKFAEAVVSLDGNHPKWVLGVGVNDDGNIYADIKPIGTRIIVR